VESAREVSRFEIAYRPRINPMTLAHDMIVNHVRIRFAELWPGSPWVPEKVLRAKHGREPAPDAAIGDGLIEHPMNKSVCALEIENTLKAKDREDRRNKAPLLEPAGARIALGRGLAGSANVIFALIAR
jgi:hypothetical protein